MHDMPYATLQTRLLLQVKASLDQLNALARSEPTLTTRELCVLEEILAQTYERAFFLLGRPTSTLVPTSPVFEVAACRAKTRSGPCERPIAPEQCPPACEACGHPCCWEHLTPVQHGTIQDETLVIHFLCTDCRDLSLGGLEQLMAWRRLPTQEP